VQSEAFENTSARHVLPALTCGSSTFRLLLRAQSFGKPQRARSSIRSSSLHQRDHVIACKTTKRPAKAKQTRRIGT